MDDTPETDAEKAQAAREGGAKIEYDTEDQSALEQNAPAPAPAKEAAEI